MNARSHPEGCSPEKPLAGKKLGLDATLKSRQNLLETETLGSFHLSHCQEEFLENLQAIAPFSLIIGGNRSYKPLSQKFWN